MTFALSKRLSRAGMTALMVSALLLGAVAPRTASADGAASTRNIILGAAAVAAGIIIYNNVAHKRAAARNAIVGYTRDGGTVYSDGRIVYPNGRKLYASNGNGRTCGYDDLHERCGARAVAYYPHDNDDRNDRHSYRPEPGRGWDHQRKHADKREHDHHDRHDGDSHDRSDREH